MTVDRDDNAHEFHRTRAEGAGEEEEGRRKGGRGGECRNRSLGWGMKPEVEDGELVGE